MSSSKSALNIVIGFGAAALLAAVPHRARATEILTVSDGVNTATITGNGSSPLAFYSALDPTWSSQSSWTVMAGGMGVPFVGTTSLPELHLNVLGDGAGTLTVSLQEDGFSASGSIQALTQIGGVAGDNSNVTLNSATTGTSGSGLSSLGTFGPGAFSSEEYASQTINGSYGLDLTATLTEKSPVATSFDASVAVPEPGALSLLGAGLLGCIAFVGRRRRVFLA